MTSPKSFSPCLFYPLLAQGPIELNCINPTPADRKALSCACYGLFEFNLTTTSGEGEGERESRMGF